MTPNGSVPVPSCGQRSAAEVDFRKVMGSVCTPVSVVTTLEEGRPHGTTVSAFASLSLEPPMVLVALDLESDLLRIIRRTRRFGLNVLSAGQSDLAMTFARKGADKFAGVSWGAEAGLPRLIGVAGWLACEVEQLVPGGDHVVAMAVVFAASHDECSPLTYHRRGFGTHAALVAEA
ncbi:flavin reductase family protein [Streptomyces plumbiresistens]|uniref:Flavin reductase family protein n=1 Tax=Streptomyces plumbiresistens TaxID=511811 RepID=A0ABP7TEW8_9ACTN